MLPISAFVPYPIILQKWFKPVTLKFYGVCGGEGERGWGWDTVIQPGTDFEQSSEMIYVGQRSHLIGWRTYANLDWRWVCRGWPINEASQIAVQKLATQTAVQDHLGSCQKCRNSGPTPDLLHWNLQFNNIPKWLVSTVTFGKRWFKKDKIVSRRDTSLLTGLQYLTG